MLKVMLSYFFEIFSIKPNRKVSILSLTAILLLTTSCKKEKDQPEEDRVQAQTSIRLVHGSYLSNAIPADLYLDDVKLTTSAVAFSNASVYYPATSGSRKIVAKNAAGTVLADTIINIADGSQYSFFIKDRSWLNEGTVKRFKTGLIPVVDNNTAPPIAGMAKVRFVNANSQPLNVLLGSLTFLLVNPGVNGETTTTITQSLGYSYNPMESEFSNFNAGETKFRVHGATSSNLFDPIYKTDLTATLEPGKLYTVYATSTEFTVNTTSKSPLKLTIVASN